VARVEIPNDRVLELEPSDNGYRITLIAGGLPVGAVSVSRFRLMQMLARSGLTSREGRMELRATAKTIEVLMAGVLEGRVEKVELVARLAEAEYNDGPRPRPEVGAPE
jgi:hypothetical protein